MRARASRASGASPAWLCFGQLTTATGLVSVMPQAWTTATPCAANRSIITGGQAEPPMPTRRTGESPSPRASTQSSSPIQTVGTPAVRVTPSRRISPCRLSPSRRGPGMTSFAPAIAAA